MNALQKAKAAAKAAQGSTFTGLKTKEEYHENHGQSFPLEAWMEAHGEIFIGTMTDREGEKFLAWETDSISFMDCRFSEQVLEEIAEGTLNMSELVVQKHFQEKRQVWGWKISKRGGLAERTSIREF